EQYEVVNEMFSGMPGVEVVSDQRELLESLFSLMNIASVIAIALAAIMLITAILLIATTIRLSAFSRRRETGIMRLVGASKTMIQLPFLAEGVVAAMLGAAMASIATWEIAKFYIAEWLAREYTQPRCMLSTEALWLMPLLFVIALILAAASSMFTLRRYLRV